MLTVMTGKGLHSKGNKSVLKPAIISWCQEKGLNYEEDVDQIRV
jgi:DNA-nicking Smr family endonuclease